MVSPPIQRVQWTSEDLEGFPENGNRYEIIEGELFVTRAPHWDHQKVSGILYKELLLWSANSGLGEPSLCPGLVFSPTNSAIPDVVWISKERLEQLLDDSGHLTGAPELVVEVLSRSENDRKRDRQTKLKLYSVQGVREYWIVDYQQKQIEIYRRNSGLLEKALTLLESDRITSPLLPEFSCAVENLFE